VTFTIGLTGGIASGKTYISQCFEELGVPLLEADIVAREVVMPPSPALDRIAERFGHDMLQSDGTLDRPKMRQLVFSDPQALRDLEAITHPAIRDRIGDWRARQPPPYCVLSNAILIESGMYRLVDRVLVVDATPEVQLRRLLRRDNIDAAAAKRMLAAQADRATRLKRAHDVVDNGDESRSLRPAVLRLHHLYQRLGHGDQST
jgi:dephospho-CoA kinase